MFGTAGAMISLFFPSYSIKSILVLANIQYKKVRQNMRNNDIFHKDVVLTHLFKYFVSFDPNQS